MNRRDLMKRLGIGAIAALPVTVAAEAAEPSTAVGPVLMERVCDGGEAKADPKDWARWEAERISEGRPAYWCGTRFRWWLGTRCMCPNCLVEYAIDREEIKKYTVKS